jgi:hypothetical protein
MAFTSKVVEANGRWEIYANDLLFATVMEVSPSRQKGKYKWSYYLKHLSVETYTIYKSPADAIIEVENYINLLNRNL